MFHNKVGPDHSRFLEEKPRPTLRKKTHSFGLDLKLGLVSAKFYEEFDLSIFFAQDNEKTDENNSETRGTRVEHNRISAVGLAILKRPYFKPTTESAENQAFSTDFHFPNVRTLDRNSHQLHFQ